MGDRFWTEARVEQLRELLDAGRTFAQIAAALGCERNAAIGKARRLGFKSFNLPVQPKAPINTIQAPKVTPPQFRNNFAARNAVSVAATRAASPGFSKPVANPSTSLVIAPITIMELTDRTCRWPVSEPEPRTYFYCGSGKEDLKTPYCPFHTGRGVNPILNHRRFGQRALAR